MDSVFWFVYLSYAYDIMFLQACVLRLADYVKISGLCEYTGPEIKHKMCF